MDGELAKISTFPVSPLFTRLYHVEMDLKTLLRRLSDLWTDHLGRMTLTDPPKRASNNEFGEFYQRWAKICPGLCRMVK